MLVIATLVAALFGSHPRPTIASATAGCPAIPETIYRTNALRCPALDVSGRLDATPSLEPVFDVDATPSTFARIVRGAATLTGLTADGRVLFVLPIDATGDFHATVPLAPAAQAELARLRLVEPGGVAERIANPHGEPHAEAISTGDTTAILAWNARSFPAVRVSTFPGGPFVASGTGESTYEQLNVTTGTPKLIVEFSDGLHSTTRVVRIFGR